MTKISQNGEPDVNYKVALALANWRAVTPLSRAVEFWNFDFEFGDEPADTGLKDNFQVLLKFRLVWHLKLKIISLKTIII